MSIAVGTKGWKIGACFVEPIQDVGIAGKSIRFSHRGPPSLGQVRLPANRIGLPRQIPEQCIGGVTARQVRRAEGAGLHRRDDVLEVLLASQLAL